MQPHFAIPPLTEEGLQKLVGMKCKVPVKSNPKKVWWVTIRDVRYCTSLDAIVTVEGHRSFGHPKQVPLSRLTWKNHVNDPLIRAMVKARGERAR